MKKRKLIIFTLFGIIFPIFLFSQSKSLQIPNEYQIQNQLCWSASINMILNGHGFSSSQCAILNQHFSNNTCNCTITCHRVCIARTPCNTCNYALLNPISSIKDKFNAINNFTSNSGNLSWATLKSEIDLSNPFITRITGAHIVVVKGYVNENSNIPSFILNDPYGCNSSKMKEVFFYGSMEAAIVSKKQGLSAIKVADSVDTCKGAIRKILTDQEINTLNLNPSYDVVNIIGGLKKQVIYCPKSCDTTLVTIMEKRGSGNNWNWYPKYVTLRSGQCINYVRIGNLLYLLTNKSDTIQNAIVRPYSKVILSPYPYEMFVFESKDGRIIYAPVSDNFWGFKSGIGYTSEEVINEYFLNIYFDFIKNKIPVEYLDFGKPVFPLSIKDFKRPFTKFILPKAEKDYFNMFENFEKTNNFKALDGLIKNYPNKELKL